jgi:hypothetical protein
MNTVTMIRPQMPATTCPTWCTRGHAEDWQRHVDALGFPRDIPRTDGTVSHLPAATPAELVERFEPMHLVTLAEVVLTARESVRIDVQEDADGGPCLYLTAEGEVTADQAREVAARLLEAADAFEALV